MEDGEPNKPATNPEGNKDDKKTPQAGQNDSNDNPSDNSLLSKASTLAERIETANKKTEELLIRQEKLAAESLLGGTTGGRQEVQMKEETPKEYRDRIDKEIMEGKHND